MIDYEITGSHSYICPYCKYEGQWNGDPIGYDGDEEECECGTCGKYFDIIVDITVEHHCYPKEDSGEEAIQKKAEVKE